MKGLKHILLVLLIVLATGQAVQFVWEAVPLKPLNGVTIQQNIPALTWKSWYSGQFQQGVNTYLEEQFGFRPFLVRLNNQFYFSLFSHSTNPRLVVGKNNYLYEIPYIRSYFGEDFPGKGEIDTLVTRLDTISRYLNNWNTELVIAIAPNKAHYFPEYIPSYMLRERNNATYSYYLQKLLEHRYPVLDANGWFKNAKDTTTYPLMAKTGIHWSKYGASLFADSLTRLIGTVTGKNLPHFEISELNYPAPPEDSEVDMENLLNIFTEIDQIDYANGMRYNVIQERGDEKPSLLMIGDSFFWVFYKGYFIDCFSETTYWYYFSTIFPEPEHKVHRPKETDVAETVARKDVIVILATPPNMHRLGFGFIDHLYTFTQLNRDQKIDQLVPFYQHKLRNVPGLMDSIKQKAELYQVPLDSMINDDARWMADQKIRELFPRK